jgi:hypothetical protein
MGQGTLKLVKQQRLRKEDMKKIMKRNRSKIAIIRITIVLLGVISLVNCQREPIDKESNNIVQIKDTLYFDDGESIKQIRLSSKKRML